MICPVCGRLVTGNKRCLHCGTAVNGKKSAKPAITEEELKKYLEEEKVREQQRVELEKKQAEELKRSQKQQREMDLINSATIFAVIGIIFAFAASVFVSYNNKTACILFMVITIVFIGLTIFNVVRALLSKPEGKKFYISLAICVAALITCVVLLILAYGSFSSRQGIGYYDDIDWDDIARVE